jgi:hypothetical protein
MISTLDFLWLVLALGVIPIVVLLSMILWRGYVMMTRADNVLSLAEKVSELIANANRIPLAILEAVANYLKK